MANPNMLQGHKAGEAAAAITLSLMLTGISLLGCRNLPNPTAAAPSPEPVPTAKPLSDIPPISTALMAISNSREIQSFLDARATDQSAKSTELARELRTQQDAYSTQNAAQDATQEAFRQSVRETAQPVIETALADNRNQLSHATGPHRGTLFVTQTALAKAEGTLQVYATPQPNR